MSKIALITGSNKRIGLEAVKAPAGASQPYTILMVGRTPQKVQDAIATAQKGFPSTSSIFVSIQVDIESNDSIERAFAEVSSTRPSSRRRQARCPGDVESHLERQHDGHADPDLDLRPIAAAKRRTPSAVHQLGHVHPDRHRERGHSVNKVPPKGWSKTSFSVPAYRSAKTGLNMLMREWYRWLKEDGVKVFAISPRFLAIGSGGNTEASKKMGAQDPWVAGPFIHSVIEGERDADVGKVIDKEGIQPW